MPEIFLAKHPPIHSKAALRGAVFAFIASRKEVTHLELVAQFGEANTDETLEGLYDRCHVDFAAGKYVLSSHGRALAVKSTKRRKAELRNPR